jgi:ferric-dicitrate binding protein FerR (iron transport regulator)
MENIQARVIEHLSGESSDQESRELMCWVRESPENAKEFARISLLHGQLRSLLSGEQNARESGALDVSDSENDLVADSREVSNWSKPIAMVLSALAATLVIGLGIYFSQPETDIPVLAKSYDFARVGQLSNVVWKNDSLAAEDRLGVQTLELQSGIISLHFDSGVDVTIEGPAKYELVANDQTRLHNGVLVANVPPGAEGFRVDTPTANVIDLGTSFGVNVEATGSSEVLVFDGEVEIVSEKSDSNRRIKEGESVRFDADGAAKTTEFNALRFNKLWPVFSGVAESSESIRFLPPWPKNIRTVSSDEQISLFREGHSFQLNRPLDVNISRPGKYNDADQLTPGTLESGENVCSYLMQYLPTQKVGQLQANRIQGSITFDQPVLGMIVLHEELVASGRISRLRAGEGQPRRQLELTGNGGDWITLSDDRRTVTVDLISPGRSADLVRVIVEGRKRRKRNKRNTNRK